MEGRPGLASLPLALALVALLALACAAEHYYYD